MKLNTLENLLAVLKEEKNEVILSKEIIEKAAVPLERMLEMAK